MCGHDACGVVRYCPPARPPACESDRMNGMVPCSLCCFSFGVTCPTFCCWCPGKHDFPKPLQQAHPRTGWGWSRSWSCGHSQYRGSTEQGRGSYKLAYPKGGISHVAMRELHTLTRSCRLQSHQLHTLITREITQAGTSTTRGHFGCIFKAIADCAT